MATKDIFYKKVKQNTIVLIIVALVFLGIGSLRLMQGYSMDGFSEEVCTQDFDNMTRAECEHHYMMLDLGYRTTANIEALFCYSICALVLMSSFIYRRHSLSKE